MVQVLRLLPARAVSPTSVVVGALLAVVGALSFSPVALAKRGAPVTEDGRNKEFATLFDVDSIAGVVDIWLQHQQMVDALPGLSVAIATGDGVQYKRAFGASPTASGIGETALTPSSPLFAGSVTKVLTAALVLKLVELKTLSLDDPVAKHIPEFRVDDTGSHLIRIRHLLRHSSGLPREVPGHPYWVDYAFPSNGELIRAMSNSSVTFAPGAKTQYSNAAFGLLGVVVERATKLSLNTLVRTHLLAPVGIESTTMRPSELLRDEVPLSLTQRKRYLGGRRATRPVEDTRAMAAAFGALSTPSDLARFGCFLASSRHPTVISQASRDMLFYGESGERSAPGRGLGMKREASGERVFLSHTGWYSGYRTHLAIAPEEQVCIVVQATADDAKVRPLAFALLNAVLDARGGAKTPRATRPTPIESALIGTYGVQWLPDFSLVFHRGALRLYIPNNAIEDGVQVGLAAVDVTRGQNGEGRAERIQIRGGAWDGAAMHVVRDKAGHIIGLRHEGGLLHFERRVTSSRAPARGVGGSGGG